jgi:hypothetical protein
MNKTQLAHAFASGQSKGSCHNARIDADGYYLHGNLIASRAGFSIVGDWCGYYTVTAASHLNAIIKALRQQNSLTVSANVSYAKARDISLGRFTLATVNTNWKLA